MNFIVVRQFIKSCVSVKKCLWVVYKNKAMYYLKSCASVRSEDRAPFECNPGTTKDIGVTAQSMNCIKPEQREKGQLK